MNCVRVDQLQPRAGRPIPSETSELIDGTLIDICSAILAGGLALAWPP